MTPKSKNKAVEDYATNEPTGDTYPWDTMEQDLDHCLTAVSDMKKIGLTHSDVEAYVDAATTIDRELMEAIRAYTRGLRKEVALEACRLTFVLQQLRKLETVQQFKDRRHDQLLTALHDYNRFHLTIGK